MVFSETTMVGENMEKVEVIAGSHTQVVAMALHKQHYWLRVEVVEVKQRQEECQVGQEAEEPTMHWGEYHCQHAYHLAFTVTVVDGE
jgi:hypothetical protein